MIPTFTSFSDCYGEDIPLERLNNVVSCYKAQFGEAPLAITRAPGRVNLIGEHIDYHGFSVMPMSLKNDILIAIGPNDDNKEITIANVNPKFAVEKIPSDPSVPVDVEAHCWGNYFRCGYKGVFDTFGEKIKTIKGFNCMFDGNVPSGAGLSSSSAMVVSCALATLQMYRTEVPEIQKEVLAELCRKSEFYVGTMGGGMDQAISCLGLKGHAKHIHFNPLRAESVKLPNDAVFVVANSLTPSEKAVTAVKCFNMRVVEGMLGSVLLAKSLEIEDWASTRGLLEVSQKANLGTEALESEAMDILHDESYTIDELKAELGDDLSVYFADSRKASAKKVLAFATEYKIKSRVLHVLSENSRVSKFAEACSIGARLDQLGNLMLASHESCSTDYECSCEELDDLVLTCIDAGAHGARLTGAGWGGCCVALISSKHESQFKESLCNSSFYKSRSAAIEKAGGMDNVLFTSPPFCGACVFDL
eukprot:TRINITY_DN2433_c0_g1_i1.p1 TRINITY_DN2433_c0_g1~~TRINITY_DN2433_c0_g1_i1.p1  ORF type:complete len:476 (-),score=163.88 TRINITY_DN2433_c0_g1_i1:171-1598(-)